jgi:hypothetical protein
MVLAIVVAAQLATAILIVTSADTEISTLPPNMRQLYLGIINDKTLDRQRKRLFSQLAIDQKAWDSGLIDYLLKDADQYGWSGRAKHIEWSREVRSTDGKHYRVYLFQSSALFSKGPGRTITCVFTTHDNQLLYWQHLVNGGIGVVKATLNDAHSDILAIHTKTSLILGVPLTYRYRISPTTISLIEVSSKNPKINEWLIRNRESRDNNDSR